jgi:carbamoylphosphate synthase large subunit
VRRILVTGVGRAAGRSLAEQLVARGIEVVGVDTAQVAVEGVSCVRIPPVGDHRYIGGLIKVARDAGVGLVIPTLSDELVQLGLAQLSGGPPFVLGPPQALVVAGDKWLTYRRLAAAGLNVPRSALPSQLRALPHPTTALGLPFLSKPRCGHGARGVVVHRSADATLLRRLTDDRIVQQFAPGPEYTVNLYLAADPIDDVAVPLAKTALAGDDFGNALQVRRMKGTYGNGVAGVARRAARTIGLTGPADVDVRLMTDGTPVILEINARFGTHSAHAPEVLDAVLAEYATRLATAS